MSLVKIYCHIVIRTKHSLPVFNKDNKQQLYSYIGGILRQHGSKPVIMNGPENHIHILTDIKATQTVSDLVHDVKLGASYFIKSNPTAYHFFEGWAGEYAAFSCSASNLDRIIDYIRNQEQHHRHKTFEEEMKEFCELSGIEYYPSKD